MSAVEETYDVIVVGSGGALVGAYAAASRGLRTLVVEKTDRIGGTVAYSGAGLWFPGSAPLRRAGVSDDVEPARTYLRDIIADPSREALQDAYLATAPQLVDELEANPSFGPFDYGPVPDYFFGTSGPDGMAVDRDNRLVVAHASLGGAFVVDARGEVTHFVKSPAGTTVTNVAYRPGTSMLVMTESETGTLLEAELPAAGAPLFSHA